MHIRQEIVKMRDPIGAKSLNIRRPLRKLGSGRGVRKLPQRIDRGERGLTTLEWLLIVAAVAGLAALAVVLVQNVVDDTAEEISGNNARITAAKVAANRINSDAVDDAVNTANPGGGFDASKIDLDSTNSEFSSKCTRLNITYSDAEVTATWNDFGSLAATDKANSSALRSALEKQSGCEVK